MRQKILRKIIKKIIFSSINIGINQGKDKNVFLGEKDMEADTEEEESEVLKDLVVGETSTA